MFHKFYCFLIILSAIAFPIAADAGIGSDQEDLKQRLGGAIYRDLTLSFNENMACMTCHHPSAGFADPKNRIFPEWFPVSQGSIPTLYGGRNAPMSAYA
ncbi:MAG: cytochrome c peroxidase, partial [Syntrophobacteraceae bacterium]